MAAEHTCGLGQTIPQAPQLLGLDATSTHCPPQRTGF
jgi:hypothetical protein